MNMHDPRALQQRAAGALLCWTCKNSLTWMLAPELSTGGVYVCLSCVAVDAALEGTA